MTQSGEAHKLTEHICSIISQQRHLATRVIIATQEPTLSPRLLDLCSVTFVHRFLSPAWYETLKGHLAGVRRASHSAHRDEIFQEIVGLHTGEALVFCPTAVLDVWQPSDGPVWAKGIYHALGDSYIKIRIRKRISEDGGKSIMANDKPSIISEITFPSGDRHSSPRTVILKPEPSKTCSKTESKPNQHKSALAAKYPDPNVPHDFASSQGSHNTTVLEPMKKWSTSPADNLEDDRGAVSRALRRHVESLMAANKPINNFRKVRNAVANQLHLPPGSITKAQSGPIIAKAIVCFYDTATPHSPELIH